MDINATVTTLDTDSDSAESIDVQRVTEDEVLEFHLFGENILRGLVCPRYDYMSDVKSSYDLRQRPSRGLGRGSSNWLERVQKCKGGGYRSW